MRLIESYWVQTTVTADLVRVHRVSGPKWAPDPLAFGWLLHPLVREELRGHCVADWVGVDHLCVRRSPRDGGSGHAPRTAFRSHPDPQPQGDSRARDVWGRTCDELAVHPHLFLLCMASRLGVISVLSVEMRRSQAF